MNDPANVELAPPAENEKDTTPPPQQTLQNAELIENDEKPVESIPNPAKPLNDAREEAFVQYRSIGMDRVSAYKAAWKARCKRESATSQACRIEKRSHVLARLLFIDQQKRLAHRATGRFPKDPPSSQPTQDKACIVQESPEKAQTPREKPAEKEREKSTSSSIDLSTCDAETARKWLVKQAQDTIADGRGADVASLIPRLIDLLGVKPPAESRDVMTPDQLRAWRARQLDATRAALAQAGNVIRLEIITADKASAGSFETVQDASRWLSAFDVTPQ